jgi:DNA-binding CsgD family transcriptional regulator
MITKSSSSAMTMFFPAGLSVAKESKKKTEFSLLSSVLEGFKDGVLILNQQGDCLHANQEARVVCHSLDAVSTTQGAVPACLWSICKHLVENRELFSHKSVVVIQSLDSPGGIRIRAKVQWLEFPSTPETCLLVMLENVTRSAQTTALLESVQYNLTPREKDVWLLRRANHSYEEIASQLYIAVNTVKRHLKSIHAKRKEVLGELTDSVV